MKSGCNGPLGGFEPPRVSGPKKTYNAPEENALSAAEKVLARAERDGARASGGSTRVSKKDCMALVHAGYVLNVKAARDIILERRKIGKELAKSKNKENMNSEHLDALGKVQKALNESGINAGFDSRELFMPAMESLVDNLRNTNIPLKDKLQVVKDAEEYLQGLKSGMVTAINAGKVVDSVLKKLSDAGHEISKHTLFSEEKYRSVLENTLKKNKGKSEAMDKAVELIEANIKKEKDD